MVQEKALIQNREEVHWDNNPRTSSEIWDVYSYDPSHCISLIFNLFYFLNFGFNILLKSNDF